MEDPQLVLDHNTLPWKSRITHLGVMLDELCNNATAVEDRVKKFCGAVNSVVSRLGGKVLSNQVWMKIVDTQLFPVLSYGSHLWNIDKASITRTVDVAYQKGIRPGFGMRSRESIRDRLKECFCRSFREDQKTPTIIHETSNSLRKITLYKDCHGCFADRLEGVP
ncbi:uncharacterized protein LOC134185096 [Corticium candelabrum]|uniref:uncharacterized protein LOC134185096 n=1 Tax=Corticium candelabrum TaxID=121492 RepID=UPI002E3499C9|nr:uncharacterized protein LOC134185096 [Corticium candelabrum]